jgi:predicted dehydrogenase
MRVGLLGTGPWALMAYAPALSEHPELELTGVWGRRPEAAASLAGAFGSRPYDDVDRLIADVEAVAIALPPSVQAPLAARAAGAGRHLLLDKPLAVTVEAAAEVVAATRRTGVSSVVFFTTRFGVDAAGWIDEQAATGGWFTARADWIGSVFADTPSPFAHSPWRRQKGALWDVGPHALSVLLPVLGDVEDLTAAAGPGDTVHLVLRHSGGASSTATLSLTAPSNAAGATVELRGKSGVSVLPRTIEGPVPALCRAADGLLAAAGGGGPHPCDAAFGLRVVEILADAEERLRLTA